MAHVLLGYGEALPVAEVIFSLRRAGHEVSVFARSDRHPARHLPLRAWRRVAAPETDADAALADLRSVVLDLGPDIVLPLDDPGVWALNIAAAGVVSAGATGRLADVALDKSIQIAATRDAGLNVPETLVIRTRDDLDAMASLTLPAIAKPALAAHVTQGRLTKGSATYLSGPQDVSGLRDTWQPETGPLLLQPLLDGVGEGVFGFAHANGVTAWSAHRRVRMMNPHGSGSSACQSIALDSVPVEAVSRFVARLGWRGPFMVELLRDQAGRLWFMELNGRMWGSMALARRQGLEYPAWAVASALEPGFVPLGAASVPGITVRDLGREILHLLFVLRGPRSEFHRASWPSVWTSARSVLRPGPGAAFYNFDPDHPRYFLREAASTVLRTLRR